MNTNTSINGSNRSHPHARGIIAQQKAVREHLATCQDPVVQEILNPSANQGGMSAILGNVTSQFSRRNVRELEEQRERFAKSYELVSVTMAVDELVNAFPRTHGRPFRIAFMQTKGGVGKTAGAANDATQVSFAARVAVIVVEMNENNGTIPKKLAIPREGSLLITEIAKDTSLVDSYGKVLSRVGKHPQVPVYAFLSDPNSNNYKQLTLADMVNVGRAAERQAGFVVYDTGNGLAANEAAFLLADVIVVPIYVVDEMSYETALTTMMNLCDMGHGEKVANNVRLAINGVTDDRNPATYMAKLRNAATLLAGSSSNPDWKNDPEKMLNDLGISPDKMDMIAHSDRMREAEHVSVLLEEMGEQNIIDTLTQVVNCMGMPLQDPAVQESEIERRIRETEKPRVESPILDQLDKGDGMADVVAGMSPEQREALMQALASRMVAEKAEMPAAEASA